MKKTFRIIAAILCTLAISSCDFLSNFVSTSTGDSTDTASTSTNTEEEVPLKEIKSATFDDDGTYNVGDVYKTSNHIKVRVTFKDNTTEEVTPPEISFLTSQNPNNEDFDVSNPFDWAGKYKIKLYCTYTLKDGRSFTIRKSSPEVVEVKAKTLIGVKNPTKLEFQTNPVLNVGDTLGNKLNFNLTYTFNVDGNTVKEHTKFNKSDANYTIELFKNSSLVSNPLTHVLSSSSSYKLDITDNRSSVKCSFSFETGSGYYRLNANDFALTSSDLNNAYAPAKGDVKMLVIPIKLSGNWTDTWTTEKVNNLNDYYFGSDPLSLKSYYETASFGQMTVSGMVSEVYTETSESLTTDLIMENDSRRLTLIANAITYIENHHPEIDFSDYDLNDDRCLDNVHLITNFNTSTYYSQEHVSPWGKPLWPHMSQTGNTSGTLSKPAANVYSLSAIDHVTDAITAIHEQGHIFGLNDYYDYGYTGVDYVGSADMQSSNIFDWNSYSKLTVGWVSPYVVSDECEITIGSASKTGDCLIIPANNSTFNQSAFDEYFLIELFTQDGNNAKFTDDYKSYSDFTGKYGVRMYHVDSRVFTWNGYGFTESTDKTKQLYLPTDNDCYGYEDRLSYYDSYADYKLLTLLQRGETDTFGQEGSGYRHYLTYADLFKQGDVFNFGDYSHFLSKQHLSKSKMDNGETFPYRITFTAMSNDSVTINIERI